MQGRSTRRGCTCGSCEDGTPRVDHEDDAALIEAVRECGLPARVFGNRDMLFGGVGAAMVGPAVAAAAADGRREAATAIG